MADIHRAPGVGVSVGKNRRVRAELGETPRFRAGISQAVVSVERGMPDYSGMYEVVPAFDDIILPTANRKMARDVIITEIPVYTVNNPSGGNTVIIGEGGIVFNG